MENSIIFLMMASLGTKIQQIFYIVNFEILLLDITL